MGDWTLGEPHGGRQESDANLYYYCQGCGHQMSLCPTCLAPICPRCPNDERHLWGHVDMGETTNITTENVVTYNVLEEEE